MNLVPAESSVIKAGDKYGRYTVLGVFKKRHGYQKYGKVQCACGSAARFVQVGTLRNGTAKSCGCLHKELVSKHGLWGTPLFKVWSSMLRRCTNPKDTKYTRYGGRGIFVCEAWKDPNQFVADMGQEYKPGLTLDRIDNDGPYSPENCRWATRKTQTRNYSRNVLVTYRGETMCLRDWADAMNINYGTLWDRLYVQKLPPEIAFNRRTS